MDHERYSRQTMLAEIGEEGQKRLSESKVLIIGVGGLGSAAAIYLAGAGVGRIGLCDPDVVSISNLQRQVLYSTSQIGELKAVNAARRLVALNSDVGVETFHAGLTEDNAVAMVSSFDLVIDCTDNYATRFLIDKACAIAGKPWIYGSIGEFVGQTALFNGRSGTRYSDLYPDIDSLCAAPKRVLGVLGAVPGVIGALQAAQAVKFLTGFGEQLDGRLFNIDLITLQTNILDI
ncbi:MAG: HesA/MoeB/ThiF family protein [Muribaculaceae bacterium]|nr:HesA/MoeB/ThiF family protein [Muribaculaceae bacterium]